MAEATPETTPMPAPAAEPQPDRWLLSRGRWAEVQMPDLYEILGAVDAVPSQIMIDVLNLLDKEGAELPVGLSEPQLKFLRKRNRVRGLYSLASLILVKPRLVLEKRPLIEGEIGPADLSYGDVEGLYYAYFLAGHRNAPLLFAPRDDAGGASGPVEPGGDVEAPAE